MNSQHQTLQLSDVNFQFQIIDALANNDTNLQDYKSELKTYKTLQKELKELFHYDPDTGLFTRLKSSLHSKSGDVAGYHTNGYLYIYVLVLRLILEANENIQCE